MQTWDEYYTQTLTLGVISGPEEGVLTLCTVFAFTAYEGGASFWHNSMLKTVGAPKLGFLPDWLYDVSFTEWYIVYGAFVLFFAAGSSILHVTKVRRQRGEDPIVPLYGLVPLVLTWTFIPAYLYLRPGILTGHLVPFTLYVGLVNAYSVGQIIVGHLVKEEFPYSNILVWPLALAVFDSLGFWPSVLGDGVGQVSFVYLCLGLSVGVYGSFVVCHFTSFSTSLLLLLSMLIPCSMMLSPRYVTILIFGV